MIHYFWSKDSGLIASIEGVINSVHTFPAKGEYEYKNLDNVRVIVTHKFFGHMVIDNITEIHINCSKSVWSVAFESDTDGSGQTMLLNDVIAFWWSD